LDAELLSDKLRHLPHTHLPTEPLEKALEVKRIGDLIENYLKVAMKKQKHLVRCYGLDSLSGKCSFQIDSQPTDWRSLPGNQPCQKGTLFASWQLSAADTGFRL